MPHSLKNLNWYPGHMKKTKEMIKENLRLVDIILEVIDARIPISSRNPAIDELTGSKDRLLLLNKVDLADETATKKWTNYFADKKSDAFEINSQNGQGIKSVMKVLERKKENKKQKSNKPYRVMIVGVPNSGKSSLINRLTARKVVGVGNKPGYTKGKQWITLDNGIQLLDTPGILWPKFEDPKVGLNLAFCGSIKDEIMDVSDLALELIRILAEKYPQALTERYKLEDISDTSDALDIMDQISKNRGYILPGKRIDYERAGRVILDEFRSGTMGRITLESPGDVE